MKVVSFQNDGLIDPRCITTIGVSVKEGENPIGFFGTGLKYAISIILRNHGEVTIYRGLEPLRFTTKTANIRGSDFSLVCMNEQELGFTTDLGKHWEMWQAFREIYCNTQDEDGICDFGEIAPCADKTTIQVSSEEFRECYANIDRYILRDKPIFAGPIVEFHKGPSNSIFYRTIKVAVSQTRPFLFPQNYISKLRLTEDRTIASAYDAQQILAQAIVTCKDEKFLEQWLTALPEYAEHYADLDWPGIVPSDEFIAVTARIVADPSRPINGTAKIVLSKSRPIAAWVEADLHDSEREELAEAIRFCKRLKFSVDEFPITVIESLGNGILGQADTKGRMIFISRRALDMGNLMLASTLIEEWAHIKHGFDDCTREMQNWLFDVLMRIGQAYLHEKDGK